ncbi:hypothetical protein I0C86_38350 [Plantactinospora sp. S1510]|uniref:NACHT domain-containing protein n=1 Tax=Plantactinospora alkalitolerans TaxID=2789879 RepID=A0ABS0H8F7_9ACTN|nr:hypothetical protein [Plantactinospora alkalitolerans]MBF9134751.1 hypothetical protein [Plantactinospora alkalitolerans]
MTALAGLSAALVALLAVATNWATNAVPPSLRKWTEDPRWTWGAVVLLLVAVVAVAGMLQRLSSIDTTAAPVSESEPAAAPQVDESLTIMGPLSNLPLRNRSFIGRTDLLEQISEGLVRGPIAVVAVRGLGGLGKSAIALEFAHRGLLDGRFRISWWIRAESAVTLVEDLIDLAAGLGQPPAVDQDRTVEILLAELRRRDDWLLVFDNVAAPGDVRRWLLPNTGSTLITSRLRGWRHLAVQLDLAEFDRAESMAFLGRATSRGDPAAADRLAAMLGDLPLALAQAAGYMDIHDLSIAAYVELYRNRDAAGQLLAEKVEGYPASVATTWLLHYEQLERDEPASLELLRLCSFLDVEDIDLDVLLSARAALPARLAAVVADPLAAEQAIGALSRTGLVTRPAGRHIRLHRLVAEVTRLQLDVNEEMQPSAASTWTGRAAALLNSLFPERPATTQEQALCAVLARHATAVLPHADYYGVPDDSGRELLARLTAYLESQVAGDIDVYTGSDRGELAGESQVSSAYAQLIRNIAPTELIAREQELAELAAFATEPGRNSYLLLLGSAWSGKSALMASFAQHPPAGVDLVAFFVTARLAAQDDVHAFMEAVLEQLAVLLGEPMPVVTATLKAALFASTLHRAAEKSRNEGRRLVLVVDGLDEDRGVAPGPDVRSIAASLPNRPPSGMRVIVTSRPNPPLPADVPHDHPLRNESIVRNLESSAHAAVIRRGAQSELRRLLVGTAADQDVLGQLVAAAGGLSISDLAYLTGRTDWEIEEQLAGVSGRTFAARAGRIRPDSTVYLLAHEELMTTAVRYLGEQRLATYRERLHAWADDFRERAWPADTPEYLLGSYFRLLESTGDVSRMIALAGDRRRQDRLLDLTGGDNLALMEIATTTAVAAAAGDLDLDVLLRLAVDRDRLRRRNEQLPPAFAGAWILLERPSHADLLARSIEDPARRATALAEMAAAGAPAATEATHLAEEILSPIGAPEEPLSRCTVLARTAIVFSHAGRLEQARVNANLAERIAQGAMPADHQVRALAEVAAAFAAIGDREGSTRHFRKALDSAEAIPTVDRRSAVLVEAMPALAAADPRWAQWLADSVAAPGLQARILAEAASVLAAAGDTRAATESAIRALASIEEITEPGPRAQALARLAATAVRHGDPDTAADLMVRAETCTRLVNRSVQDDQACADIVTAMAVTGDPEQARILALAIDDLGIRGAALAHIAAASAQSGDQATAEELLQAAIAAVRSIEDTKQRFTAYQRAVPLLATVDPAETERVVRGSYDGDGRILLLAEIAGVRAVAGQVDAAATLAAEAEAGLDATVDLAARSRAMARVAAAYAPVRPDHADRLADSVPDPSWRMEALAAVARAHEACGHSAKAQAACRRAVTTARSIPLPGNRSVALAEAAKLIGQIIPGQESTDLLLEAEALARSLFSSGGVPDTKHLAQVAARADALNGVRMMADALCVGDWHDCLPELAKIRPEIAAGMAAECRRPNSPQG